MKELIAIGNRKGGSGKTSTSSALSAGLSLRNFKVLTIDLDGQGNISHIMGAKQDTPTILDVLTGAIDVAQAIQHAPGGDIIPATPELDAADVQITGERKEYRLKDALNSLKKKYDFVIMDLPPAFGAITLNALTAASSLVIPLQADVLSLTGLEQMGEMVKAVRQMTNPSLIIRGLLLNRFNNRAVLSRALMEVFQEAAVKMDTRLFDSKIREGIAVREAQANQMDIFHYSEKSNPAVDYAVFIDELFKDIGMEVKEDK